MSRDNIIGIIIILAILIGYSIYIAPSEEERLEQQRIRDSIADARMQEKLENAELVEADSLMRDTAIKTETEKVADLKDSEVNDSIIKAETRDRFGIFAPGATGDDKYITVESDYLVLRINTKGGFLKSVELKDYKTWDQKPLKLFHEEHSDFALTFAYANRVLSTSELFFEPYFYNEKVTDSTHVKVGNKDSLCFGMRLYVDTHIEDSPQYIEFYYGVKKDDYLIDFDIRFVGLDNVVSQNPIMDLGWNILSPRQEKSFVNEQRNTTMYYQYLNDGVSRLRDTRDDSERLSNRVKWISFKQQFFSIVMIADNHFTSAKIESIMIDEDDNPDYTKDFRSSIVVDLSIDDGSSFPMNLYLGPNHYQTLRSYEHSLERQIPLGWSFFLMSWINRYLVIPVFNWLDSMDLSYGLIILLLTIMLKIILLPIAYKTYISSAKMRVLKPDIEELSKKFPKKEDAMKKQQATMALYKKAGVNPMAGCVPLLLQLPILLALFRFFPASIELRQEGFLWADDLSSYDSILDLPFTIPFYGDHVSLFTILMAVSTIIYTKMNSQMMSTGNQMPGMKMMLYFMPVMLVFIFNNFASGLSYYYFLTNVLTFGQMFIFRRFINEDALRAKIEANKKKPVKQSKWAQKMQKIAQEKQAAQKRNRRR